MRLFFPTLIISSIMLLTVNGCVTTALVAGATAATATAIYDKRSFTTMKEDSKTLEKINQQLATTAGLKDVNITIECINHNVLLVGQVLQSHQKALAYQIAKDTPMVKHVYNQIKISATASSFDNAKDLWLTGKAKTALLEKKGLRSAQVKVIATQGTVYLMGLMENRQQALATDAVRQISGVNKVVTLFENVR